MSAVTRRLVIAILVLGWAPLASAQTADEVIEKHLTAIGGRAALAKVTSRRMTGTITLSTPGGDVAGPIESLNQAPNKARTLIKLDLSALGAGEITVDQRFDGTAGYVLDSMQGNRAVTGNMLENMRNATFPTPFLDYKERGTTVTVAKEKAGDRDAFVLSVKPKTGPVVKQYVDAESYLPMRLVVAVEIPGMGELDQTSTFSDFRDVDGVKVPFKMESSSAAQSFTILVNKVEHNIKVDETLFSKPAGQ